MARVDVLVDILNDLNNMVEPTRSAILYFFGSELQNSTKMMAFAVLLLKWLLQRVYSGEMLT
jgi:hypothetical protein